MPKRRLLFYTHGLVGGGGERVWALVASGLLRRGHDVSFAVDFVAQENEHLLVPDLHRHVLGKGHGAAIAALARVLKEERPEAAFAAIGASNLKLIAAKALSGWQGAAVLSAHGRFDAEPHFLGRTTYAATALTSRLTAQTIAVSDHLRHYLIDRFHARADRVVTIHNGIALPARELVPDERTLARRENIVLGIGRLVPEKGFTALIDAFSRCKLAQRLMLVGDGPERENLERMVAQRGLTDRVVLPGYVRDLAPIYAQGKMLVLPSHSEAFGNVVVEALSYGLPVVATRSGGPEEILDNGRHGRLVAIDDADATAKAIDETLSDPGDPTSHRARAEEFSIDRALDRFEQLIESVLRERA